jgi:hypothetical protein
MAIGINDAGDIVGSYERTTDPAQPRRAQTPTEDDLRSLVTALQAR